MLYIWIIGLNGRVGYATAYGVVGKTLPKGHTTGFLMRFRGSGFEKKTDLEIKSSTSENKKPRRVRYYNELYYYFVVFAYLRL